MLRGLNFCADFLEQFDGLKPVSDQDLHRRPRPPDLFRRRGRLAAHLVEKACRPGAGARATHHDHRRRAAREAQPGIPLDLTTDDALVKALLLMQQHIDAPLSATEIARRLGASSTSAGTPFPARGQHGAEASPTKSCASGQLPSSCCVTCDNSIDSDPRFQTGFLRIHRHFIRAFRERRGVTPVAFRATA